MSVGGGILAIDRRDRLIAVALIKPDWGEDESRARHFCRHGFVRLEKHSGVRLRARLRWFGWGTKRRHR